MSLRIDNWLALHQRIVRSSPPHFDTDIGFPIDIILICILIVHVFEQLVTMLIMCVWIQKLVWVGVGIGGVSESGDKLFAHFEWDLAFLPQHLYSALGFDHTHQLAIESFEQLILHLCASQKYEHIIWF